MPVGTNIKLSTFSNASPISAKVRPPVELSQVGVQRDPMPALPGQQATADFVSASCADDAPFMTVSSACMGKIDVSYNVIGIGNLVPHHNLEPPPPYQLPTVSAAERHQVTTARLPRDPNVNFCPGWSDLRPRKLKCDHLPLHANEGVCSRLDVAALKELPATQEAKQHFLIAIRWIEDAARYDFPLPPRRHHRTKLTKDDVNRLNEVGKFVFAEGICGVQSFAVPEIAKDRRRPIFWPDINEAISKDLLQASTIPLKDPIRRQVKKNSWSIQYDFKGWFDQIPLTPEISRYFAFDGNWCLGQLPMGFRPAVEVAQAITLLLVDFELPAGVEVCAYIDNVRFVGPTRASVQLAGALFTERCEKVNALIGSQTEASQSDTFLGETYDYRRAQRKLSDKTIEKLIYIQDGLKKSAPQSYRQIAAIFGVLFYATEVSALSLAPHFDALTFFRRTMSIVTTWDAPSEGIPADVNCKLQIWVARLLRNIPVPVARLTSAVPDIELFVDASEFGWGCVSIRGDSKRVFSQPWSQTDKAEHKVGSSVTSEPLGALRAVLATSSVGMQKVVIHTDHMGLVYAGQRGYGKARTYNEIMLQLQQKFPSTEFVFKYVPGPSNPADPYSRGVAVGNQQY